MPFFPISSVSNISYRNDPNRHCQYIYPVFYVYALLLVSPFLWQIWRVSLCIWHPYGKLQDFDWTSSISLIQEYPFSCMYVTVSQSVSPLDIIPWEDQPSPCSFCLNTIYLAITQAPLTAATLTFNLENCLALVVCFHYCQLFRFLCRMALWLTVPQSTTRGPPVAFLCFYFSAT